MSAVNTGYQSQNIAVGSSNRMNKIQLPVYKYLDIDSTYRNRADYPDPNSFIVRNVNNSTISPNNLVANNLPVYSFPFSQLYPGGIYTPLSLQSGFPSVNGLTLDARETTSIDNFYAGYYFESIYNTSATPTTLQYSTVEYATIASYNSSTQVVTFTSDLSGAGGGPVVGSNYVIRKNKPLYIGNIVSPVPITSQTVYTITTPTYGTIPTDTNSIYYLRIRKASDASLNNLIVQVTITGTNQITLSSPLVLTANDSIEIIGPGQNIITSLRYASGGAQNIQAGDYELELLWLSVPNQILDVGYGGTLDRYPYIYCSLYTGITNTTQQVLYSNNPNTSRVLFKVPVNEYF